MNYETMEDVLIEKNCNKDDDENIIIENDKNDITLNEDIVDTFNNDNSDEDNQFEAEDDNRDNFDDDDLGELNYNNDYVIDDDQVDRIRRMKVSWNDLDNHEPDEYEANDLEYESD